MIDQNQFRATLLLCDSAQVQGGKLYILGGGWARALKLQELIQMALAIRLEVPWHEANRRHQMKIRLLNWDGQPVQPLGVELAPGIDGFEISGDFEVGRPPGLPAGSFLDQCIALNFQLNLAPAGYLWELRVNDDALALYAFEVLPPPGMVVQAQ